MSKFKLSGNGKRNDFFLEYEGQNIREESMKVKLYLCKNRYRKCSTYKSWLEENHLNIEKTPETLWLLKVFITDKNGNCYEIYNPQRMIHSFYQESKFKFFTISTDFEWVLEGTKENAIKLLEKCEYNFLNCEPSKNKNFQL